MVYEAEMQDLMVKFEEKDKKIYELADKIKRIENMNSKFEEQISDQQINTDKINKEKSVLEQQKIKTDKNINRLTIENTELKEEILSVRTFIKQYQGQIEDYKNELNESKTEIEKYI